MSDATGIDTQGRGRLEWSVDDDPSKIFLSMKGDEWPHSAWMTLTGDEARKVIAGLQRCVEAVEGHGD